MSTENRKFLTGDNKSIHGAIVPAEVRDGDQIFARVITTGGGLNIDQPMRVWRMSPLGVELINESATEIPKGHPLDVEIKVGNQKSNLSGLVVDDLVSEENKRLLHIRLTPRMRERIESVDRRGSTRWICSDDFFPTGVASNPAKFNDFLYFKVRDISIGGLKLHTSLRNKFIIPGMVFDAIVNFPMISQIKVKLEVKSVRVELVNGKDILALGVVFPLQDKTVSSTVAQYLTQFGTVNNPDELRNQGFVVPSIANAVSFSYVRTKEDYDQVLELRLRAYRGAGKVSPDTKAEDMADAYDARSRIVIGKFKGKIVCSARLIFNQFEDKMEQEAFVKWPDNLPRRDEMVEVTRACTMPEFRRSDLLLSMFRFMVLTVAQSKRKWIVICATDQISSFYEKIGFADVGISYNHTKLNGLKHNIMVANVPDAMAGKTVDLVTWNVVWSDVSGYMENYGILEMDPMTNIRLMIYRIMAPVANLAYRIGKAWRSRKKYEISAPAEVPAEA